MRQHIVNIRKLAVCIISLLCFTPDFAIAQSDARLRNVAFDPGSIVRVDGCPNLQTMIKFGPYEHVENVALGDSTLWQAMLNIRGNLLFVKPLASNAFTNMTVVSNAHIYNFEMHVAPESDCSAGGVIYMLSFNYVPDADSPKQQDIDDRLPPPAHRNASYTYNGDVDIVPVRVFDDGDSTYLKWADGTITPAIYAINSDNTESLINYHMLGDYFVIEQVTRGFVLRRGQQKATLYNDAYVVKALDSLSPKPHSKP